PFLRRAALPPGWRVRVSAVVGSTNDLAREAGRRGEAGRTVFVADFQTAGRGRQGRTWVAPPGFGLLFSVLFRLPAAGAPPLHCTMLVAVALAEALERHGLRPAIKWPNDVLLEGRKVAGILAEAFQGGGETMVVVGCGVNVGDGPRLPHGLPPTATSLGASSGGRLHRGALLVEIL